MVLYIREGVIKHRQWDSLHCSVIEGNWVWDVVIEIQMGGAACEWQGDYFDEALQHTTHAHVVYELLLNCAGDGPLHIEEEDRSCFTSSPRFLNGKERSRETRNKSRTLTLSRSMALNWFLNRNQRINTKITLLDKVSQTFELRKMTGVGR